MDKLLEALITLRDRMVEATDGGEDMRMFDKWLHENIRIAEEAIASAPTI